MKKNSCYCTFESSEGQQTFLCETKGHNIVVSPCSNADPIDSKLPVVATLPIKQTFFLNIDIPFKSIAKARRVMDSVLDSQLPFSIDDSVYVFKSTSKTSLSGAHKFIVFGALKNILTTFINNCSFPQKYSCITHKGIVIWDAIQASKVSVSDEICFAYFEFDGQGCLLCGMNNTLEACYSLPANSKERLARVVKSIKAKYKIQFDMAKNICWTNVNSEISDCFSSEIVEMVTNDFEYNCFNIKDSENFLQKALAKQYFKKKILNLLEDSEFVNEQTQSRSNSKGVRAAILICSISIITLAISLVVNAITENKLYSIDTKINAFASQIAGYNIPKAMKGETVHRAAVQVSKKRRELLKLFDINPPDNMQGVWNVIKEYKTNGDMIIHNIDITQKTIIIEGKIKNSDSVAELRTKLVSVGYEVSEQSTIGKTGISSCKLEITQIDGGNDK